MKYVSGEEVKLGDKVLIEDGKTEGVVYSIIETSEKLNEWELNEPCLILSSSPFGLVSWQIDDDIVFLKRM